MKNKLSTFYKKKTISALASSLISLALINHPVFASRLFSDIPAGYWAENPADVMSEQNIMQGASSNEFGGNLLVNRYDAAKIISGLLGGRTIPTNIILLSDVRSGHPDFRIIMKILSANLMETQNNKFNGEKKVTRYELANLILKTLNYMQAETLSIRQPPKTIEGNLSPEKKEVIDKAVNQWQLTDGYTDWDVPINRYGALEMVARAAINLNPELKTKIGDFNRQNAVIPVTPTPTPISVQTPVPTPVVTPIIATPIPTPVISTPVPTPVITPIIATPIPTPIISTPVPTPVVTPIIVIPTPVIAIPSVSGVPTAVPTPIQTISVSSQTILKNNIMAKFIYNFAYSETIPSVFPAKLDTVRNKDDLLGPSIVIDGAYWLKDAGTGIDFLKDAGILFGFSSLGSYLHPTETATVKPDTEISETFRGYISGIYKLYKTSDTEFAAGADIYLRLNGRDSKKPANSYWRTSKTYFGIGGKALLGYKIMPGFNFEGVLGAHYVSQSINETIVPDGTTPPSGKPTDQGNTVDRFDIEIYLDGKYDLFKIDNYLLYADAGVAGRFLLGDGKQTIMGAGIGVGINY